jgi:hypothetical protein
MNDLVRCSGINGESPFRRVQCGEAGFGLAETTLERVLPRSIENDDLRLRSLLMHFGQHCIEADTISRNVALAPDLSVDRDKIVLSRNLKSEAAEVEKGGRPGADFADEGIDRTLHIRPAHVLLDLHVEVKSAKLPRERAGIVDRRGKRRTCVGIVGISDYERHAWGSLLWQRRDGQRCQQDRCPDAKPEAHAHDTCAPTPLRSNAILSSSKVGVGKQCLK